MAFNHQIRPRAKGKKLSVYQSYVRGEEILAGIIACCYLDQETRLLEYVNALDDYVKRKPVHYPPSEEAYFHLKLYMSLQQYDRVAKVCYEIMNEIDSYNMSHDLVHM